MNPSKREQSQGHANWIAALNDAQLSCRKTLKQASVDVSDPKRALWPAVPRSRMTQEHQTVAQCHAAVLDYAELVRPYKNRCAGKWTESIREPHEFADGSTLAVCLAEIEEWADRRYSERVGQTHELTGRKKDHRIRRVHIPTGYVRDLYNQLNDCRERLQLAADPPTPENTVDGPEDVW